VAVSSPGPPQPTAVLTRRSSGRAGAVTLSVVGDDLVVERPGKEPSRLPLRRSPESPASLVKVFGVGSRGGTMLAIVDGQGEVVASGLETDYDVAEISRFAEAGGLRLGRLTGHDGSELLGRRRADYVGLVPTREVAVPMVFAGVVLVTLLVLAIADMVPWWAAIVLFVAAMLAPLVIARLRFPARTE
jgi:hypothetical protein